jgi:hypothetical protein
MSAKTGIQKVNALLIFYSWSAIDLLACNIEVRTCPALPGRGMLFFFVE